MRSTTLVTAVLLAGVAADAASAAPARPPSLRATAGPAPQVVRGPRVSPPFLLGVASPAGPTESSMVFTVNSTADTPGSCAATCTLRGAIGDANANPGADTIKFALGSGTPTIAIGSPLPTLTEAVTIDGATGGATRVELDGSAAGPGSDGLTVAGGSSTISALVVNRFDRDGIVLASNGNTVRGSLVGTDAAGAAASANGRFGIAVFGATNRIGGTTAATRDVVSGNGDAGIYISGAGSTGNVVFGNRIGTDAAGTTAVPNGNGGIDVFEAPSNTIGGMAAGNTNLISGNTGPGVTIFGAGAASNRVQGNLIGTDAAGTAALGNTGGGVNIVSGSDTGLTHNILGGTSAAARNVVSANGGSAGILLFGAGVSGTTLQGNYVGTDVTGAAALGNTNSGIQILDSPANTVAGNVASGNGSGSVFNSAGIWVRGSDADGNTLQANRIGTDAAGTTAVGNVWAGIVILGAPDTKVMRNVSSGNGVDGVHVENGGTALDAARTIIQGNFLGTNAAGTAALPNAYEGVDIISSPDNVVGGTTAAQRNVISGNSIVGVFLEDTSDGPATRNKVQGNYIGTDVNGTAAIPNSVDGVAFVPATGNTVGGTTAGSGNLISGNGRIGLSSFFASTGNRVLGNLIGTDKTGAAALGNAWNGVYVDEGSGNVIGGSTAASRNVISANGNGSEVWFNDASTSGNFLMGNYVGTNATGTAAIPNAATGVELSGAVGNTIGGMAAGSGNLISGNAGDGIFLLNGADSNRVLGNRIGTNAAGTAALANGNFGVDVNNASHNKIGAPGAGANTISFNANAGVGMVFSVTGNAVRGNSIDRNGGLGIDLGDDGVTPNDAGDADTGPNDLQNFPVLTSATSSATDTTIAGTLSSTASTSFMIDLYSGGACDPSKNGEGKTFLKSVAAMTSSSGAASFSTTVPQVLTGKRITATATPNSGSTSEFSACKIAS